MQGLEFLKKQLAMLKEAVLALQKLLFEMKPNPVQNNQLIVLHHSATSRDFTRAETIINQEKKQYGGKTFYNVIVDKNGTIYYLDAIEKGRKTKDICVLGDFTKEQPTDKQIEAIKLLLREHDWITHKDLAAQGKATPSLCPGKLTDFL